MIKFLDLRHQYAGLRAEIDAAIHETLETASFVGGPTVRQFEEAFAGYQEVGHCVGVGNGTDAIEIALEAMAFPPGSEVIVPANTFIASAEAITRSGHQVVFCDIDPDTLLLDLEDVRARVTSRTVAVMAVHLYGSPCDMGSLVDFARSHGLRVIEDCAQAHGAEWEGRRVGGLGDVGTFSFYPGKTLGGYGDGGAIVTNDEHLAAQCRMIANHGRTAKYVHEFEGRNSRLDSLQAAVLSVKLMHLDDWVSHRNDVASAYRRGLGECDQIVIPVDPPGNRHGYHLFVVRTQARDALRDWLSEQGVETGIHYPTSLPNQPAYRHLPSSAVPFVADAVADQLLSLPMGEHLHADDVDAVVRAVQRFFA